MKTTLKMLIVSALIAFAMMSCREDDPNPDPPQPLQPQMTLSVSDIALMVGMKNTVDLSNANDVLLITDNANIVDATYQQGKISLEAKNPGSVTIKIRDKSDSKRFVSLKVLVVPLKSGIMSEKGTMLFEANWYYQTPKTLFLSTSGKDRKHHLLKVPLQNFVENQTIDIEYKKSDVLQHLQATVSLIKGNTIYTKLKDGRYFIFQKK